MSKIPNLDQTKLSAANLTPHSAAKRARKLSGRRYGKAATKVRRAVHEMKRGELRAGRSKKKVASRKQAIAIGLSEARRAGGKVPTKRKKSANRR